MKDNLTILSGDNRQTLRTLPEKSVHCVVTSPPYFALRSYLEAGHELKHLEMGSEPTPEEYVRAMVGLFGEVRRVMRDDAVLFVNLGDTYARDGGNGGCGSNASVGNTQSGEQRRICDAAAMGLKALDRIGIPHRFALAMQTDGWYFRDEVVWAKPAPMPASLDGWRWARCRVKVRYGEVNRRGKGGVRQSSVTETSNTLWSDCTGCDKCRANGGLVLRRGAWRTTPAHEFIFMFSKTDRYFCDAVAAREPAETSTIERNQYARVLDDPEEQFAVAHDHEFVGATRNPRSVWRIASGGSSLRHYAMFPPELPRRCIEIATPAHGVCANCGAPWARVVNAKPMVIRQSDWGQNAGNRNAPSGKMVEPASVETLGWRATCTCGTDNRVPATVLDPFGGSGTTAEEAIKMGRRAILCELNPAYVEIIRQRLMQACPLFVGGAA